MKHFTLSLLILQFLLKALIVYYLVDTQQVGIGIVLGLTLFVDLFLLDHINEED